MLNQQSPSPNQMQYGRSSSSSGQQRGSFFDQTPMTTQGGGWRTSFSNNHTPVGNARGQSYTSGSGGAKLTLRANHRDHDKVQVSMDVPYPFHPYLIGPGGEKCKSMMRRLGALVHFPDSNCRPGGARLNTVLISGPVGSAEMMRNQLRIRSPIHLNVDLACSESDGRCLVRWMGEAVADRRLPIRVENAPPCLTSNGSSQRGRLLLKTEWRNDTMFVRFCNEFLPEVPSYTLPVNPLPLINPWNVELDHRLVNYVQETFGCELLYPPREMFVDRAPYYFVRGSSVSHVLQTARFLFGLTMFQLSFTLPANVPMLPSSEFIEYCKRSLLVHVSVKPMYKEHREAVATADAVFPTAPPTLLCYEVTLRSFEFCHNPVYQVRSLLLNAQPTVYPSEYGWMMTPVVDSLIPIDVFALCKLFYPLYSILAESGTVVNDNSYTSRQHFSRFYGGPYSIQCSASPDRGLGRRLTATLNGVSLDEDLTKRMVNLLGLDGSGDDGGEGAEMTVDEQHLQGVDGSINKAAEKMESPQAKKRSASV